MRAEDPPPGFLDLIVKAVEQVQQPLVAAIESLRADQQEMKVILGTLQGQPSGGPAGSQRGRPPDPPDVTGGFIYLSAVNTQAYTRHSSSNAPVSWGLEPRQYQLLRHAVELLHGEQNPRAHWVWGPVIHDYGTDPPPRNPKTAFSTTCAKLTRAFRQHWILRPFGRAHRGDNGQPILLTKDDLTSHPDYHPYDNAHPVGDLFDALEDAAGANRDGDWARAVGYLESALRIDPDNWWGHMGLFLLQRQAPESITDEQLRRSVDWARAMLPRYQMALDQGRGHRAPSNQLRPIDERLELIRGFLTPFQ